MGYGIAVVRRPCGAEPRAVHGEVQDFTLKEPTIEREESLHSAAV